MRVTRHSRSRRPARAVAAGVLMWAAVACQPVAGELDAEQDESASEAEAETDAVPADLQELLEQTTAVAAEWQTDPLVAESHVELADDGRVRAARVTYLAPDADRFLVVRVGADGVSEERPTLATLGLDPMDADALAEVPPMPADALDPPELAAATEAARDGCGLDGGVTGVLYSTGAPLAWDGSGWAADLGWRASVTTNDGGVTADPVTAAPVSDDPCIAAP